MGNGAEMIPESEIFNVSGPSYLKEVNWNCPTHRRIVMASLVQGVYVHERDRQKNRFGTNPQGSEWWEFFHFHLQDVLTDSKDSSIFGVILELKLPPSYSKAYSLNAPKYVIAFRGTLPKRKTILRDLYLDIILIRIINILHRSSRFKLANGTILPKVEQAGDENVWLAGHSLGSAIALLAGKEMAKRDYFLPTYLFNSPFLSPISERITNDHQRINQRIHIARSVLKVAGLDVLKGPHQNQRLKTSFDALNDWAPNVFVNASDPICNGYIRYFAYREYMKEIELGEIENIATTFCFISEVLNRNSEPFHLIPSAKLVKNVSENPSSIHGIKQWWDPNLKSESLMYRYR